MTNEKIIERFLYFKYGNGNLFLDRLRQRFINRDIISILEIMDSVCMECGETDSKDTCYCSPRYDE